MTFDGTDPMAVIEKSVRSNGRQSVILRLSSANELNALKVPHVDELLSPSGSNTLSQTRNDSITPNKEDELELKHRVIQGSSIARKSQKFDSATPSESSYKGNSSDDDDDDQMDFDDDIGEEVAEQSGAPVIPVSVNLDIEK